MILSFSLLCEKNQFYLRKKDNKKRNKNPSKHKSQWRKEIVLMLFL